MNDPRIAPIEENLFAFFERSADSPLLRRDADDDVVALHSDIAFPPFNTVARGHFGQDAAARAREVATRYIEAGLPWLWWLTPSTTSPELEAMLEELGLVRDPCPGMYRELGEPAYTAPPAGVEVTTTGDVDAYIAVLVAAFEMPDWVAEPMASVMRVFPELINVLASLDGRPVACGTAYVTGATAGIYNIASLPEVRGRGTGYAVTATLLDLATESGADHAVLHSSEEGLPLYRRLGFVEVCQTPQYIWMPQE
jgi:GNAT superfamily N-acetyltransferase